MWEKAKLSIPKPNGGTGLTLFSKLVRTKDLRSVQGDDPRSTKPKLTVGLFFFFCSFQLVYLHMHIDFVLLRTNQNNSIRCCCFFLK